MKNKPIALALDEPLSHSALQERIGEIGFGRFQLSTIVMCGMLLFFQGGVRVYARELVEEGQMSPLHAFVFTLGIPVLGFVIGSAVSLATTTSGRRPNVVGGLVLAAVSCYCASRETKESAAMYVHLLLCFVGLGVGLSHAVCLVAEVTPFKHRGFSVALLVTFSVIGELFVAGTSLVFPTLCALPRALELLAVPLFFTALYAAFTLHESPSASMNDLGRFNSTMRAMESQNEQTRVDSTSSLMPPPRQTVQDVVAHASPNLYVVGTILMTVESFAVSYPHPEQHVLISSVACIAALLLVALSSSFVEPMTPVMGLPFVLMAVAAIGTVDLPASLGAWSHIHPWVVFALLKALSLALVASVFRLLVSGPGGLVDTKSVVYALVIGKSLSLAFPSLLAMAPAAEEATFAVLFGLVGMLALSALSTDPPKRIPGSFRKIPIIGHSYDSI